METPLLLGKKKAKQQQFNAGWRGHRRMANQL